MGKMTLEELRKLRESKQTELKKRDSEGKDIQIIVGMGTCGIAAGAKDTLDAFLFELDKTNLVNSVVIRQTGCMGLCSKEPTVEVVMPGMPAVIYGDVDRETAKEIIHKHILNKTLLDDRILDRPSEDILKK